MEEDQIIQTEEQVEDLEDIDVSDIEYENKSILDWQKELTVELPPLPCNTYIIMNKIIDIANKYQIAYNAYNTLMVLCSKAESQYKAEKYRLVNLYIEGLRRRGVTKLPSKETIEVSVINSESNARLRAMMDRYKIFSIVKEFFENHKTKLEKTMSITKNLSYSSSMSDKVDREGNI